MSAPSLHVSDRTIWLVQPIFSWNSKPFSLINHQKVIPQTEHLKKSDTSFLFVSKEQLWQNCGPAPNLLSPSHDDLQQHRELYSRLSARLIAQKQMDTMPTTSTGLLFLHFSSMSWVQRHQRMKSQRRMRSRWYQLVRGHIKARLCCSVSGSRLQSQCLWLHRMDAFCMKQLAAEDSQPPTKILASIWLDGLSVSWLGCKNAVKSRNFSIWRLKINYISFCWSPLRPVTVLMHSVCFYFSNSKGSAFLNRFCHISKIWHIDRYYH